jgi:F0F1-type ATP synthase membrane subunit c/vacuolar-type H+-ATPase subunit K
MFWITIVVIRLLFLDINKALLLGCALAEATAIYGFVIALLIILFLK